MANDGNPTWKEIEVLEEKATVLFHFRRNEDNTHYFPTIKHAGEKIDFQSKNTYIVCREPAWIVCDQKLYGFKKYVDGNKLMPFVNKRFIVVPKKMEDTYYRKFIAPLIASFDVYARGFEITTERYVPEPVLTFSEMATNNSPGLFPDDKAGKGAVNGNSVRASANDVKILFDISFNYGDENFRADNSTPISVIVDHENDDYTFRRIERDQDEEVRIINKLKSLGLDFKNSRFTTSKSQAVDWLINHVPVLQEENIRVIQNSLHNKKYFIGETSIKVEVKENIDWFDVHAVIKFGPYEIPFKELRKIILKKGNEIILPNGEIGVIPDAWIRGYSEFFAFMNEEKDGGKTRLVLRKYHLAMVQDLESGNLAEVVMGRKLEKLRNFEEIEDEPVPSGFRGLLRPYQKAGYNWLKFLEKYKFGGCLADDMGLGKTIQTLAMLQSLKASGSSTPSLLIVPTSLIYNWELEAAKFTPDLQIYNHTGTNRIKDVGRFEGYNVVLTTYGIARLDIALLKSFYFDYVILDESQSIKNPNSNISKSVKKLHSRNRLILTGTPLENSTLDLWSQMTFINPGLLGNQAFFKNEYLNPIEKKNDLEKTQKLYAIIKPFILRRHKSQVATELPEKVESIKYCSMTASQEERYEEVKNHFRNKILDQIEKQGMGKSQMMLLQGLTQLRQIANHPKMVDMEYKGDSGKMEAITQLLESAVNENHKILVFSQYVKHLSLLQHFLKSRKIAYAYLDGSTKDRQAQVERFQGDQETKLFLISLKAGGFGP